MYDQSRRQHFIRPRSVLPTDDSAKTIISFLHEFFSTLAKESTILKITKGPVSLLDRSNSAEKSLWT